MHKVYRGSKLPALKALIGTCVVAAVVFLVVGVVSQLMLPALIAGALSFVLLCFLLRDYLLSAFDKVVVSDASLVVVRCGSRQEFARDRFEFSATSLDSERLQLEVKDATRVSFPTSVKVSFLDRGQYLELLKELDIRIVKL